MALISFKDWRSKMTESSPMTRIRAGLPNQYPMPADVMSRSTPSPHVMDMAIKAFGTPEKPAKKKRVRKKKKK